jgi:hypothetical protein
MQRIEAVGEKGDWEMESMFNTGRGGRAGLMESEWGEGGGLAGSWGSELAR